MTMRTKPKTTRNPEDIALSWGETQIIEIIRDAYASNRTPEQLLRERSTRRGSLSGPLDSRRPSITESLSLVTVYRRKEGFFRNLWRALRDG